jgi:putative oxidoreductase
MDTVIGRYAPQAFALLRIVSGLLFTCHGTQKLFNWPPGGPGAGPLPPMILAAGVIELVCGLLITVGLFTGWAAFLASGEMAAAYFIAHFPKGPIPLTNGGEASAIYCFLWLYVAAHGAGTWSIDSLIRRRTPITTS